MQTGRVTAAQRSLAALKDHFLGRVVLKPREMRRHLETVGKAGDEQLGIDTFSAADLVPPYTIKAVRPFPTVGVEARQAEMERTGYNVFCARASNISIDLLTDSGTGALSEKAWAAIMTGDERYSHSETYEAFLAKAKAVFGKEFVLPIHQGRAAENIAFTVLLQQLVESARQAGKQIICTGNTFFDTTQGIATLRGAQVIDATCAEAKKTNIAHPFKGNADVQQIRDLIVEHGPQNIGLIVMTVVNNTIGGQPVSMQNLKEVHSVAKEHGILLVLDSARIFENAYMIKQREEGYRDKSIEEIVHEMTALADVILMSSKKDAIANIGGLIATNNRQLYEMFQTYCILVEGHYSYGGMSGRDLAALTVGLTEGLEESYLRSRINQVTELGNEFRRHGIPIQWPVGSHGVFVDGRAFLAHIDPLFFPAQRICAEVFIQHGVRPVEIGLSLAGRDVHGLKRIPETDLVRFTIPRRVLSSDHIRWIAEMMGELYDQRTKIGGLVYLNEGKGNGHFTSTFKPVNPGEIAGLRASVQEYFNRPLQSFNAGYLPPNAARAYSLPRG